MGVKSKDASQIYRHVFEDLLICRGLMLDEKPRNKKDLDELTHIEIAVIIKKDLDEYLDLKKKPEWFSDLDKIFHKDEVRYAYRPGSEKYIIDYAVEYLTKNISNI